MMLMLNERALPPCPLSINHGEKAIPGVNCHLELLNEDFQIDVEELPDFDPEQFSLELEESEVPAPLTTPSTPISKSCEFANCIKGPFINHVDTIIRLFK